MALSKEEEDLEKTTEAVVQAATDFAVSENPGVTNEELAKILHDTLMMSDGILDAKVEVRQEDEDEKVVREVMEAPERFYVKFGPKPDAVAYKRTLPLRGDWSDPYLESYECARAFRKK